MKHAAAALFLLFVIFLAPSAVAQQKPEWTWTDRHGNEHSRAELDKILAKHNEWLKSGQKPDDQRRADLSEAVLIYANLRGAHLTDANLTGADLFGADLRGADLSDADLSKTNLSGAKLNNAILRRADLTDADLSKTNLRGANLNNAILRRADLTDADLSKTNLRGANLGDATLIVANLSDANLFGTDLSDATLIEAKLSGADLKRANLFDADLVGAQLSGANLSSGDLSGADLSRADLSDARLIDAKLVGANLSGANLMRADLMRADLSRADLTDTDLMNAVVYGVNLRGVAFEPKSLPAIRVIATADNLELVKYSSNPDSLFELRKNFQDGGFREQERKITYALKRTVARKERQTADDLWARCAPNSLITEVQRTNRRKLEPCLSRFWFAEVVVAQVGSWFPTVFFDWTCQYGMNPGRCIWILFWTFAVCALLYAVIIHLSGNTGLQRIYAASQGDPAAKGRTERIRPRPIGNVKWIKKAFVLVGREWRVLRTAMFFSLMSAFNLGFREINFGRWIRMLTREEFDVKAVGWARVIAGVNR